MANYLTVSNMSQAEYTEKRSRFIATLMPCETEEQALRFIEEMRSKYWDARHNCFAYSVEKGRLCRFSDDGEPHGTAGKPILDVINGSGLVNVAAVVTRYFGGVLLGTGGLVRAYSKSTKDAVANAQRVEMIPCTVFNIMCEYQDHVRLMKLLETAGANIENTDFTDKVSVTYALRDETVENFENSLTESFSARLVSEEVERTVVPFCC